LGTRWKCKDCSDGDKTVDLCDSCVGKDFHTETHNSEHEFLRVDKAEPPYYFDGDYLSYSLAGQTNYLDPSYG